jgi:2-methylcitrate dehydratase PrpD
MKTDFSGLSRRNLFKTAGALLAASAVPASRLVAQGESEGSGGPPPDPTVITRLSSYMSSAAAQALPSAANEQVKTHLLDTIAAMVSGANLPPAKVALQYAKAYATPAGCTIVGTDLLCSPTDAALVNGMMAHSDETDDSHAPSHSHPGCSIVSAALAASEHYQVSGTRLLRAVALGYDVGPRVTMALGGLNFQMQTHRSTHSIAGNFGAAAAAACAAGFSPKQMCCVLDYAAQQAGGSAAWQRDEDHISKALVFGGRPARNAVSSTLMISFGATGVADILSGPDNFLLAMTAKADPAKLTELLGKRFEVMRTSIKKWTVGSPIQAPLDAIQNLRKRRPFAADDVKSIVVRVATSEAKTVNNREMPDISLQHMVAVMLLDNTASFAAAHDKPRMQDAAIMKQRAKVKLVPDEALEKLYPERQAIIEVTLNDGTQLTEEVTAVRGTPKNPMTREDITEKTRDLMAPFLGAGQTARLIDQIFNLDSVENIQTLRPLLQRTT